MDDAPHDNPPPFAGRANAIARIRQHIADPVGTPVPAFIGRDGIGKTALLRQFAGMPTDGHIGVYLPLKDIRPDDEIAWLDALYSHTEATLSAYDFIPTLAQKRPTGADGATLKAWFRDEFLTAAFRVIHRGRRLVFLLDDAEVLVETMMRDTLAEDYFAYLDDLRHPQCAVVLTLSITYENRLELFNTITTPDQFQRLGNLDAAETADALRQSGTAYDEAAISAIYKATGGEPSLVAAYIAALAAGGAVNAKDVKAVTAAIYDGHKAAFHAIWADLTLDERLVLTAISSLIYADPLRPVAAGDIEAWLVRTDYTLDLTAIHAAIRGLDYRQLVGGNAAQKLTVRPGLLQTWMLENARLEASDSGVSSGGAVAGGAVRGNRPLTVLAVLVVLLALAAAFFILTGTPSAPTPESAIPTATLSAP